MSDENYTLEVAPTLRFAEVTAYAFDRDISVAEALAELINKGLSHAD